MRTIVIPYEPPTTTATPCAACEGIGVTGDRYEMKVDHGVLLVDEFCGQCDGCGDAAHRECAEWMHASTEAPPNEWFDECEGAELTCFSCHGRTWNAVQGFNESAVTLLRVPCGCTEDRAVITEVP